MVEDFLDEEKTVKLEKFFTEGLVVTELCTELGLEGIAAQVFQDAYTTYLKFVDIFEDYLICIDRYLSKIVGERMDEYCLLRDTQHLTLKNIALSMIEVTNEFYRPVSELVDLLEKQNQLTADEQTEAIGPVMKVSMIETNKACSELIEDTLNSVKMAINYFAKIKSRKPLLASMRFAVVLEKYQFFVSGLCCLIDNVDVHAYRILSDFRSLSLNLNSTEFVNSANILMSSYPSDQKIEVGRQYMDWKYRKKIKFRTKSAFYKEILKAYPDGVDSPQIAAWTREWDKEIQEKVYSKTKK
jgi:hypothetical protein